MADSDILQAIRIIDEKIASLKAARDQLASAFGVVSVAPDRVAFSAGKLMQAASKATPVVSAASTTDDSHPVGRKEQLALFLLERGPLSRAIIVEQAGLPEG